LAIDLEEGGKEMRVLLVFVSILVTSISGCACGPSHSAFVTQQGSMVGRPLSSSWLSAKAGDQGFLGKKPLTNGNMEIGGLWRMRNQQNECRVYYEYNPSTNIVLRWRFEGSEMDCISVC
jgi:hypothetical protein